MNISEIMVRMIAFSDQNHRDINHFMKVHSFAHTIGVLEQLDDETQFILETAAIVHDIACHHTLHSIDGADYQILIEADYLVNADENGYSKDNIRSFGETYFKTAAGKNLLHALYGV